MESSGRNGSTPAGRSESDTAVDRVRLAGRFDFGDVICLHHLAQSLRQEVTSDADHNTRADLSLGSTASVAAHDDSELRHP